MFKKLVFLLFFFFLSCNETPLLISEKEDNINFDTMPPAIKWVTPRFDEVVSESIKFQFIVEDQNEIATIELYIDSLQTNYENLFKNDTIYSIDFKFFNYKNGDKPIIFIKAIDNHGNDTISQKIRIIIDNNHTYPDPVYLYPLDSLYVDSILTAYEIEWWYSGDEFFKKYILQKSSDPLMKANIDLFVTDKKSIVEYVDYNVEVNSAIYYRIIVEDIFGKQTLGNVISNKSDPMPLEWKIESVQYDNSSVIVNWDTPYFSNYKSHYLLYSEERSGGFDTLYAFIDSSINQYAGPYNPLIENWFAILTKDSLNRQTISSSFMHPPPHNPIIDSVKYINQEFLLYWNIEPDMDFNYYQILTTIDENPFNLNTVNFVYEQTDNFYNHFAELSEYYLFQIVTSDVWGLETRGPIILVSSFEKFFVTSQNYKYFKSVIENNDNKYILVGQSVNNRNCFVEIEGLGKVTNTLDYDIQNVIFNSIISLSDDNYCIIGSQLINQNDNLFIITIANDGSAISSKYYDSEYPSVGKQIAELSDNNIGVVGYTHVSAVNQDILVMKVNPQDNNKIWEKNIGGSGRDVGHDILANSNGGMYILAETYSQGDTNGDIWILELNADGSIIDTILIELSGKQVGYSFIHQNDNYFIVAGETSGSSGVSDMLIVKVDLSGNVIWNLNYGGIYNDIGYSLIFSEGGWVVAGQTYSYDEGNGDAWIVKVSDQGFFEWIQVYGGLYEDVAYDIYNTRDGGFIICGSTLNQNSSMLIKTDSRGNYHEILSYP